MNIRYVLRQLGLLIIVLSLCVLAVAAIESLLLVRDFQSEQRALRATVLAGSVGMLLGVMLWWPGRKVSTLLGRREALLLVALSWLVGAAVSGLPYWFWALLETDKAAGHPFRSFVSCYFEAMSGLTTTGATVLKEIDGSGGGLAIPKGLLFWRALTHWLGGLGIVVLFVAVLPTLGVGGKKLFQVESPGPKQQGVRPRIGETARILWLIYLALTVAETVVLRFCGLGWFDAICHTFATLATGGFSTRNASISAFDSVAAETTIIIFMILAGANFGLYYQLCRRRWRSVWSDPELRLYLLVILVASAFVVGCLIEERIVSTAGTETEPSVTAAVRHGVFQVVSIQTTTGFGTADFARWGFFPKAVLLGLMFIGASAGSTGGGIKIIRILIAFKVMLAEVERVFRPNVVRPVKAGKATIDPDLRLGTMVYVVGILMLFLIGALLLMFFESGNAALIANGTPIDFTTAASASAATLNNVGPGLGLVGAIHNYGWFTAPSMIVMSLLMVLGRLEVFAIFVLFVPRFWRSE